MDFITVLIIVFLLIIVICLASLLSNKDENVQLRKVATNHTITDLQLISGEDLLVFLRDADQNLIDELYQNNSYHQITETSLRRAFIRRWRFEFIDFDFWLNELQTELYNKENKIKRKVRSKEELYNDFLLYENKGYEIPAIDNYDVVSIFDIQGVHLKKRYEFIENNLKEGDLLQLFKDNYNEFDKKAVEIISDEVTVGYVSRQETTIVRRAMNYGYICKLYSFDIVDDWKTASYILYVKKL
ncbi:hypothetical protein [Chryseobacterium sp. MP_3.2]|uniref:hypothetical protein n=1 Tax=Chryseobacterium sp. MP_3.2 TaxID=3071712 RepID=UPI002E0AA7D6|nr:hypothetical protein [Chryseobacterium sp. MP_3.2]